MNLLTKNSSIYYLIQNQPLQVGERDLARIFDMARFDPRLMEVATEFVRDYWWNLNAAALNRSLKNAKYPYAIKPATAAVLRNSIFSDKKTRSEFVDWFEVVVGAIKNPLPQLFYIALNPIGSKSMRREESEAISCFTDFNLLAKDIPFNKGKPGIVKSRDFVSERSTDAKGLLKCELANKIKHYKQYNNLKNDEVSKNLGINRVFLSKILNNRLDGVTLDYLMEKAGPL